MACYLVDAEEPTIIDPGPTTSMERLVDELQALGVGPRDLQHIALTHIHLDHAGATGDLCEVFPNATVHVQEDGASHLVDPERLVASTRRTFGDAHDRLWGEMKPVPADRIQAWRSGEPGPCPELRPVATPGHIAHHVAYLDERDGMLFAGDAMGIVLSDGPSHPPTPPPAVDLRAWRRTLDEIGEIGPERFGATHFGIHGDVDTRREQLQSRLDALEARVRTALHAGDEEDARRYNDEIREEFSPFMGEDRVGAYFEMFSAAVDWAGVAFYLKRNP
ncbi:MAG: MBL fold metallo-hydrolase [Gemmatimonadota bacterium]|nr:MBL fold metallo-hydrolase [Gemmatimonadota bacterium]